MSYNEQLQRNGPKCTLMPAGPTSSVSALRIAIKASKLFPRSLPPYTLRMRVCPGRTRLDKASVQPLVHASSDSLHEP
jgi:hypothetical protein